MTPISSLYASRICGILAATCGLTESGQRGLMHELVQHGITEYRFQGVLGFGGKLWDNRGCWYVNCYSEDETAERALAIDAANAHLHELRGLYNTGLTDPAVINFVHAAPPPTFGLHRDPLRTGTGYRDVYVGSDYIGAVERAATGWVAYSAADPATALGLGKRLRREAVASLVLHWCRNRQLARFSAPRPGLGSST